VCLFHYLFRYYSVNMNYTEITLASDDSFSNTHFPDNTLHRFRNIFDHSLHFENYGEIAISKVTFCSTMYNITPNNNIIYYSNTPLVVHLQYC
jgi:hypothetical protein